MRHALRLAPALVLLALLAACAGHTPPPACRGATFALNPEAAAS
ncbi:hypothetical protein [Roseicella aquatilis]|nr:hypothetical protein [Roseicella aquatilis]